MPSARDCHVGHCPAAVLCNTLLCFLLIVWTSVHSRQRMHRPNQDAPQIQKTSTASSGSLPDFGKGVIFKIDREDPSDSRASRKCFQNRMSRRQLFEMELFSSGWLKNESLGSGSWGNLGGLVSDCEVEGQIEIKDADRNVVTTLNVVARVSEPFDGGAGGGGGGPEPIDDGRALVIDDAVAAKQAAIGARFSGQPTEAMKATGKVRTRAQVPGVACRCRCNENCGALCLVGNSHVRELRVCM